MPPMWNGEIGGLRGSSQSGTASWTAPGAARSMRQPSRRPALNAALLSMPRGSSGERVWAQTAFSRPMP